jgi:hypothetical protein
MKRLVPIVAALAVLSIGFGAGYWYRGSQSPFQAEMEDYALSNVLGVVGYYHYVLKGDSANLRELLDVNLNDHLARVRRYQGSIDDEDFEAAKIRTLNAAALLWDAHPPFKSQQWKASPSRREWSEITASNLELLQWAKQQCAQMPSLKCKSPNSTPHTDARDVPASANGSGARAGGRER